MMVAFQYRFVTTVDDHIAADAIERFERPGRIYRWLMERAREMDRTQRLVIGGLMLLGLLVFLWASTWTDRLAITFVGTLFVLYYFVVAPRRAEKRIRAERPAQQTVRLEFGKDGIAVDVANAGPVTKSWIDFTGLAESKRGVLLYFGKLKLLIPRRVFETDDERHEFVKYVRQFEPADTPL